MEHSFLDGGYTVFGQVIDGLDIVIRYHRLKQMKGINIIRIL